MRAAAAWLTLAMLLPGLAAVLWAYFRFAPVAASRSTLQRFNRVVFAVTAAIVVWALDYVFGASAAAGDRGFTMVVAGFYAGCLVMLCVVLAAGFRRWLYGPGRPLDDSAGDRR
jgi:hypothetical protein